MTFAVADVHDLSYEDDAFDVVHAHQVLQHVGDPVQALREMRRAAKPGGVVAVRDSDYRAFTWFPESEGLTAWLDLYEEVARAGGGEPDAGRRLKAWVLRAGFDESKVEATSSTWTFSNEQDRAWWGGLWADRVLKSDAGPPGAGERRTGGSSATHLQPPGAPGPTTPDGFISLLHGEILAVA